MSKQDEYKAHFYIVDSVKGGCGKTSLAVWKAIEIKLNDPKKRVCYIDLDLLGTSIEAMLGLPETNPLEARQYCYLNELFSGDRAAVQKKRVKRDFKLIKTETPNGVCYRLSNTKSTDTDTGSSIGMVFSSPEQKMKNMFRVGFISDGHHIDFDFFARRLNELIKELMDGGVTDFVIDMPPNSDPYTDSIFSQFLKQKKARHDKAVHLLLISTFDRAHLEANQQWLKDLSRKSSEWYPFTSVEYYFNDVRNYLADQAKVEEKEQKAQELVKVLVDKMRENCNSEDQRSFLVVHNPTLSKYSITRESDSLFPTLNTVSIPQD